MARRQRRRHRPRRARLHSGTAARRLRDRLRTSCPPNFGIAALNELRRLPADVEPRAGRRDPARAAAQPVGGGQLVPGQLPQPDHHHQPELVDWPTTRRTRCTTRSPASRSRSSRAARAAQAAADAQPRHLRSGAQAAVRGIQRWSSGGALPRGGQVFGGGGSSASAIKSCTAPDDPNYVSPTPTIPQTRRTSTAQAFCDDFALDIPWRKGLKLAARPPVVWGIDFSFALQKQRRARPARAR